MDTLTLDVRDLPDDKVRELQRLVDRWKREAARKPQVAPAPVKKRKVLPEEFTPALTRFKAPLMRALAYEEYE